nr:hypothetical protein Iba_chr02fCG11220 [Ipomoea batatas]
MDPAGDGGLIDSDEEGEKMTMDSESSRRMVYGHGKYLEESLLCSSTMALRYAIWPEIIEPAVCAQDIRGEPLSDLTTGTEPKSWINLEWELALVRGSSLQDYANGDWMR